MSVDEFNLADSVLGVHCEEFFGAVGRIVCVSAVLEDQVTTLRLTLANGTEDGSTREPVGQQIRQGRAMATQLSEPAATRVSAFFDEAERAFRRRNEIVHSLFPAQSTGEVFGHRRTRDKAVTDGSPEIVESSVSELKQFIGQLSNLARRFNDVHVMCGMRP